MKVTVEARKIEKVEVGSLEHGDAFIDREGCPYVVLNPNQVCFDVIYAIGTVKMLVLCYSTRTEPVLAHLDYSDIVTPVDAELIFTERKE